MDTISAQRLSVTLRRRSVYAQSILSQTKVFVWTSSLRPMFFYGLPLSDQRLSLDTLTGQRISVHTRLSVDIISQTMVFLCTSSLKPTSCCGNPLLDQRLSVDILSQINVFLWLLDNFFPWSFFGYPHLDQHL